MDNKDEIENVVDQKRIAKNTIYLYIRMAIVMLVELYTARIILKQLGVNDYGIYNIVGTVVAAFNYLQVPLSSATQRFYNIELGKNNKEGLNNVFNHSLYIFILFAIVLFITIEVIAFWFLDAKLQIPYGRMGAAKWALHFSILCFVVRLLKTPFEALIIAHERMVFYAYISIAEVILKLANVFLLTIVFVDKLKLFATNIFIISLFVLFCFVFYCNVKFQYIRFSKTWNKQTFKSLLSFSGWNLVGNMAAMTANQGLNILMNMFFGVVANAAMGIAGQVGGAVKQFVGNFQVAFRPQIMKSYVIGESTALNELIYKTSRFSFLLLYALVCPLIFNIDFAISLWLGNIPLYVPVFCSYILIYGLIDTLAVPLLTVIHATGKIKNYNIAISSVMSLNIVISYCLFKLGFPPVTALQVKSCLAIAYLIVKFLFVKSMIKFPFHIYFEKVLKPILIISLCSFLWMMLWSEYYGFRGWAGLGLSLIVFVVSYIPLCIYVGLEASERKSIVLWIKCRTNRT